MPQKRTIEKAAKDKRAGKSPSTQAGEFVKSEIDNIRQGKHGARSAKQAIAIGLSEARRAGVNIPKAPGAKKTTKKSKPRAESSETSARRSKASLEALRKEPRSTVSRESLAKQARTSAAKRGAAKRHTAAMKAVHTRAKTGSTTRRIHAH